MNLYVHFPFCRSRCKYCVLYSKQGSSPAERLEYSKYLSREIAKLAGIPETVYFGGGSPSYCSLPDIPAHFSQSRIKEWTVELHPADVNESLLEGLLAKGVNRISLGVQSFDDSVLRRMGRAHTSKMAQDAFASVLKSGFANAGMDLIAGWPGQTLQDWLDTVKRALDLRPVHLSIYSLIMEDGSAISKDSSFGYDGERALDMISAAQELLSENGIFRYEVSNYAKPGFECLYNMAVWNGEDYTGLGFGAHGREGLQRYEILQDGAKKSSELTVEEDAVERALFALRLPRQGLDINKVCESWPILKSKSARWIETLRFMAGRGLTAEPAPDIFVCTPRGLEVCDGIISELC